MTDIPPNIQRRRELEDRAITLGAERLDLERKRDGNLGAIVGLLHDAEGILPLEEIAKLVGVSRQTLYRWQDTARDSSGFRPIDGTPDVGKGDDPLMRPT
jgi:DNA invertase Pin-like site-specific DNA recombinase